MSDREGARALLFERLTDENPAWRTELRPLRTHDAAGLKESVLRRLHLLLNTRTARPRPEGGELTVLDYGLPDFSGSYARDTNLHGQLAEQIRAAVEKFEPRLLLDDVAVEAAGEHQDQLQIRLSGRLRSERTAEPVSFTVQIAE